MGRRGTRAQRTTMSPFLHKTPGRGAQKGSQDGAETDGAPHDSPRREVSPSQSVSMSPALTLHSSPQRSPLDLIATQQTDDQPVTPQILADQLALLQEALTSTITQTVSAAVNTAIKEVQKDIIDLGDRTDKLETYTDDIAQRLIYVEEDNAALKGEVGYLQDMCEDLENRSRRQNLRFRGIPEEIAPPEISSYLKDLCTHICPESSSDMWRFDRAHRTLGPKPPASKPPRDIVACFHYYHSKEEILTKTRSARIWDFRTHKIQIFMDLSPITLNKRRELRPVTQALRDQGIPYRWGFPFKLVVTRAGHTYTLHNPRNGGKFLKALGLTTKDSAPPSKDPLRREAPAQLQPQWSQVPQKTSPPRLALSPSPPRSD